MRTPTSDKHKRERITGLKVMISPYASGLNAHFGDRGQSWKQPKKRPRQRAGIITDSCPQVSMYALRYLISSQAFQSHPGKSHQANFSYQKAAS